MLFPFYAPFKSTILIPVILFLVYAMINSPFEWNHVKIVIGDAVELEMK